MNVAKWLNINHAKIGNDIIKTDRGVNQGTCMGPLLFLTLINQIVKPIHDCGAKLLLYADDACILANSKAQLS